MKIVLLFNKLFAIFIINAVILGCATQSDQDKTKGWSAEKIFKEAKEEQNSRNFTHAIKLFEILESRYPYGKYAQQAPLEIAYSQYRQEEPEQALATLNRFIKQHTTHPLIDYAYYLKGIINFNANPGFLSKFAQQDLSERDPKGAKESYEAFQQLLLLYPNSRYADDAKVRLGYLIGALADHELHIARYYYKRGAYLAAANRGKVLLQNYPDTKQVEGALAAMYHGYNRLNLVQLRDDAKRVLLQNFPHTLLLDEKLFLIDKPWYTPW